MAHQRQTPSLPAEAAAELLVSSGASPAQRTPASNPSLLTGRGLCDSNNVTVGVVGPPQAASFLLEPLSVQLMQPQPLRLTGATFHGSRRPLVAELMKLNEAIRAPSKSPAAVALVASPPAPPLRQARVSEVIDTIKTRKRDMYQMVDLLNRLNKPKRRRSLCDRLQDYADLGYELVLRNKRFHMVDSNAVRRGDKRVWKSAYRPSCDQLALPPPPPPPPPPPLRLRVTPLLRGSRPCLPLHTSPQASLTLLNP